jgi:hypothetical protein
MFFNLRESIDYCSEGKISSPADVAHCSSSAARTAVASLAMTTAWAPRRSRRRLRCTHNVDDDACTSGRIARLGSVRLFAHPVELADGLVIVRSMQSNSTSRPNEGAYYGTKGELLAGITCTFSLR